MDRTKSPVEIIELGQCPILVSDERTLDLACEWVERHALEAIIGGNSRNKEPKP